MRTNWIGSADGGLEYLMCGSNPLASPLNASGHAAALSGLFTLHGGQVLVSRFSQPAGIVGVRPLKPGLFQIAIMGDMS